MSQRVIPGIVNVQPPRPEEADSPFTHVVHADAVSWEPGGQMVAGPACWGRLRETGEWVRAVNWLGLRAIRYEPCDGPPEADDEEYQQRRA